MRKLVKNEKRCPICGKIFRFKRGRGTSCRKYCSKQCSKTANRKKAKKRVNVGTHNTLSLTPESVGYQLYLIRNNIDTGVKQFISDKSERDIVLDRMVYDEDGSIIMEVF